MSKISPAPEPCKAGADALKGITPACPACGGEALVFTDLDGGSQLVCIECAPADALAGDGSTAGGPTTAERLLGQVRAYADEHFPGWRSVAVRVRLDGPGGPGAGGELVLSARRPAPVERGPSPNAVAAGLDDTMMTGD